MDILDNKTNLQLLDSLLAELAKSSNEIQCAQQDIRKIQSRLSFTLVLINDLKQREHSKINK